MNTGFCVSSVTHGHHWPLLLLTGFFSDGKFCKPHFQAPVLSQLTQNSLTHTVTGPQGD